METSKDKKINYLNIKRQWKTLTVEEKINKFANVLLRTNGSVNDITLIGYRTKEISCIKYILDEFNFSDTKKSRLTIHNFVKYYCHSITQKLSSLKFVAQSSENIVNLINKDIVKQFDDDIGKQCDKTVLSLIDNTENQNNEFSVPFFGKCESNELIDQNFVTQKCTTGLDNNLKCVQLSNLPLDTPPLNSPDDVGVTFNFSVENKTDIKALSNEKRSFKNTSLLIGEFHIDYAVWRSMVNKNGKLITEVYPKVIADFFYSISPGCVVQMQGVNYNRNPKRLLVLYILAYCKHNLSTTFKLCVYPESNMSGVIVKAYSSTASCNHPTKLTRELSGTYRVNIKKQLLTSSPKLVRAQAVLDCDIDGVKVNNVQGAKSNTVFRKAKSEALAADDLHKDPLTDLFLMREEQVDDNTRYVQYVGHPLEVIIFSHDVLHLLLMAKENAKKGKEDFILHIDATGSVVRKIPQCQDKRVLYYALVFRLKGLVLPASEFLTCNHSADSIAIWLLKLRMYIKQYGKWPICTRVVSDFSWAMIIAVMLSWNRMTVLQYLNTTYDMLHGNTTLQPTVTVNVCVCHFIKICIQDVKIACVNLNKVAKNNVKQLFMQIICTICTCTNYNEVKLLIKYALIILLRTHNDDGVVDCYLGKLKCLLKNTEVENEYFDENNCNEDDRIDSDQALFGAQYKESPFYRDVLDIRRNVERTYNECNLVNDKNQSDCESDELSALSFVAKNEYYCPSLGKKLVEKYAPYLPLWSGILLNGNKKQHNVKRLSNAPIENWFGQVKNIILDGHTNLRPNRFIRKVRHVVMAHHKQIMLNMPDEGCSRGKNMKPGIKKCLSLKRSNTRNMPVSKKIKDSHSKPNLNIFSDSNDEIEESWSKPSLKKNTYFESKYIQTVGYDIFTMPDNAVAIIKSKILQNKLINDPNYYVIVKEHPGYVVCCITAPSGSKTYLNIDEISVLSSKEWFTTDIITAISIMFQNVHKDTGSAIFHDNIATAALVGGEKINPESWLLSYTFLNENTKQIFFPVNISGIHWVLCYANIENKEFAYLDPQERNVCNVKIKTTIKKLDSFLSVFKNLVIPQGEWKTIHIDHPIQSDGYNCGVYVMYFIEQLMVNNKINLSFNPSEYRHYLFKSLLLNSEDMTNICLSCRRSFTSQIPQKRDDESVACTSCNRWYHVYKNCLPKDVPKNTQTLTDPSITVYCKLCRLYYKNCIST